MFHNVYVFCLSIGVIYSAFSIIFHFISAAVDFGFDFDVALDNDFDIFLPIKPFTIMVFLTVFGGAGLITEKSMPSILAAVVSFIIAYVTGILLYRGVYVALLRAQTETKGVRDAIGREATILESIPYTGVGRISYVLDDNILSGIAKRSLHTGTEQNKDTVLQNNDGSETTVIDERYKRGETVYIWDVEDGVYYVAPEPAITAKRQEGAE